MANEHKQHKEDKKQASNLIALFSIVGLVICFNVAVFRGKDVPIFLYAIFGGGILGTDNVLKFIKAIFRIN